MNHSPREKLSHSHEHEHDPNGNCACGHQHVHGKTGIKTRLGMAIAGSVFLALGAGLHWFRPQQPEVAAAFGMVGALIASVPIFLDAIAGLIAKETNNHSFYMNQFITLAVLSCFASQQYLTGGVVAVVLLVGHILEDRSSLGANEAIQALLKLSKVTARRLKGTYEELVDADSLNENDTVRIRPGDTVPADGMVLLGFSTINQASITGESFPVEVAKGSQVFAGTSNLTGMIEIRASNTGSRTVLGRVREIVKEAQQTRAPIMRLTEEYARYYLPLVLLIAGFVLFFTKDVQRAISIIVVSIPCTFVLAGPSAMVAALAVASRMGILIKSVKFLEAANDIDTIVFDKTGTLTTGELRVAHVTTQDGLAENELLTLVAALEQHSTHPVARAVLAHAKALGLAIPPSDEVREEPGMGVAATVRDQKILVGRSRWLREQDIPLADVSDSFDDLSALHVSIQGRFSGVVYLSDTVRPETVKTIEILHEMGISKIVMLTGDREKVAEAIGQKIGIQEIKADCLPEQKLKAVRELKEKGGHVMVVGDGVNDAPALAGGDLSVAMGALGSDVAIQTADIALMVSNLQRVPDFLNLSTQTLKIINQNMLCGLIFIGTAIVLSGVGLIPPIAAAFVHEIGAFFVIFNSARLLRFEGGRSACHEKP